MNDFIGDVKYSIRIFLKNPGFTITAVAALALGIGAVTAIFSIVNTVLLKPLPVFEPDRFLALGTTGTTGTSGSFDWTASPARFMHWRAQSGVLQDVSASFSRVVNYTGGHVVEQWRSMQVSVDTFRCWGMSLSRGRSFTREEDLPNGPRVAVISRDLWTRRFAGDPRILGATIPLSGDPYTVIGIVAGYPALTEFGPPPDVFVPFRLDPGTSDQASYFSAVARLKPGVTLEHAKARLQASTGEYRARFPNDLGPREQFGVMLYPCWRSGCLQTVQVESIPWMPCDTSEAAKLNAFYGRGLTVTSPST